ncbi:MAG: hypothetical protein ACP5QS_05390 [bacterium]
MRIILAILLLSFPLFADEVVFVGEKAYPTVGEGIKYEGVSEMGFGQKQAMETVMKQAFKVGALRGGIDMNVSYDSRGDVPEKKKGFLRIGFMEYSKKTIFLRYSPIVKATFGYGLLVNQYTSLDQRCYYGRLGSPINNLQFLLTPKELGMIRLRGAIGKSNIGATIVWDDRSQIPLGQAKGAYAYDFEIPLHKIGLYATCEWAKLRDYGAGASLGILFRKKGWEWSNQLLFYGDKFVPSYYDPYYEVSPANLNTERREGLLSQLSKRFLQNRMIASAAFRQNVGEMPSLLLQLNGQPHSKFGLMGTLDIKNYKWFGLETVKNCNSMLELKGIYNLNPNVDLVISYNKSWFEDRGTRNTAEYFLIRAVFKSQ